jgi:hypothetical protein
MTPRLLCLLPALLLCACSSLSQRDLIDMGEVQELAAREAFKTGDNKKAIHDYLIAEKHYFAALAQAVADVDTMWTRFLRLKVAICRERVGQLFQPDDTMDSGEWTTADKCFAAGAAIASDGGFLQMQANCLIQQAACSRPDLNPNGSWFRSLMLYTKGVQLCKKVHELTKTLNKTWTSKGLYGQAISLLQSMDIKDAPDAVYSLLSEARSLGNMKAAKLMAQSGIDFCHICGSRTDRPFQFCPKCGTSKISAD